MPTASAGQTAARFESAAGIPLDFAYTAKTADTLERDAPGLRVRVVLFSNTFDPLAPDVAGREPHAAASRAPRLVRWATVAASATARHQPAAAPAFALRCTLTNWAMLATRPTTPTRNSSTPTAV